MKRGAPPDDFSRILAKANQLDKSRAMATDIVSWSLFGVVMFGLSFALYTALIVGGLL